MSTPPAWLTFPAPRELKHVQESLLALLSVSPADVFTVMTDDCKGSEEETGASRRNILAFLEGPAAEARRDILESGDHVDAEKTFHSGFIDVLQTTAIAETRLVLGLLLPLSIFSGRNASPASASAFCKTLAGSLHRGSSTALTQPLIRLFAAFVGRNPPLDPRYALMFLSNHGAALIALALEKQDGVAVGLVERSRGWTAGALILWLKGTLDSDQDISSSSLIPAFCNTTLDGLMVSLQYSPVC